MNKIAENIRIAASALIANKLRAALTTLGIGIGIAAVITLISLGQAVQGYVNRQFLSVGSNLVYARPVSAIPGGRGGPSRDSASLSSLTQKDLALLSDPNNVPNVDVVVPLLQLSLTTDYGSNEVRSPIDATVSRYFDVNSLNADTGRLFDDQDATSNARVAVLGQTTLKNLFPADVSPLGETIRINNVPFKVIGTLTKSGGSAFGTDQDDVIIVPLTTAQSHLESVRNLSGQQPLSEIYLRAISDQDIDTIVTMAKDTLRREHKIKPGKDDDFQVTSQKDVLNSFNTVIGLLTVFLGVIGGISLLVGGIGVMNIMLVTVTERTREIGLRKAVGAQGRDIMLQFLTESIILCFVGGFAGLAVALGFTALVGALVPDLRAAVSVGSIVLAVSVTTIIGVFFGLYPASRAAALSPIGALRSE